MGSSQRSFVLLFFLSLVCGVLGADIPPTPPSRCEVYCSQSFPSHTYPNPDDHAACTRGCRLWELEALLSQTEGNDGAATSSCNDTCTQAYAGTDQLKYSCQVGCSVPPLAANIPDESVWILNTLSELSFLKKVAAQLQWTADTSVNQEVRNPSSSLVLVDLGHAEKEENEKMIVPSFFGSELTVSLEGSEGSPVVSYREYHYSSLQFVLEDAKESPDLTQPAPSIRARSSLFAISCNDWESFFDILIVILIILFFLALLDHLFLPKKSNLDKKKPIVPIFNDKDNRAKRPVYVQDSNRCTYAPLKEKYVEGTLFVINNKC